MPSKDDTTVPEKFLTELREFANGGYFLLTFSEQGRPVVHYFADTEKDELALEGALDRYMEKMMTDRYKKDKNPGAEDDDDGEGKG